MPYLREYRIVQIEVRIAVEFILSMQTEDKAQFSFPGIKKIYQQQKWEMKRGRLIKTIAVVVLFSYVRTKHYCQSDKLSQLL